MAYTKTVWENGNPVTPLDEVNLNKIEDGIYDAHVTADQNETDIGVLEITVSGHTTSINANTASIGNINTALNTNTSDITALNEYNTWRNIESDPLGPVQAENVDNIFIGWAGAVTVTLPATPTVDDRVRIADAGCDFSANNLTVAYNGNGIMGNSVDYIIDYANASIELCWSGAVYGWVVTRAV